MAKILIADDQLVMRNMFKVILQDEPHEIKLVCDGEEAFKAAKAEQFDLVLSDLYMPKYNGIELTEKIRSLSSYNGVPVLIISTENKEDKKAAGRAAGANGWIIKPITKERLLPAIKKLLG
jgi:two-component system chemotaxis response regulator CheY